MRQLTRNEWTSSRKGNTFLAGTTHDANLVWNNSRRLPRTLDSTIDVMLYKERVGFGYVM